MNFLLVFLFFVLTHALKIKLLYFYTPSCPHCRNFSGTFEALVKRLTPLINIQKVNCNDQVQGRLCQEQNVRGVPALKLLYPTRKSKGYVTRELSAVRDVRVVEGSIVKALPEYVVPLRQVDDGAVGFVLYLGRKDGKVPFFMHALGAEFMEAGRFSYALVGDPRARDFLRGPLGENAFYFQSNADMTVKMDKKINYGNVLEFIQRCISRRKMIDARPVKNQKGLSVTWSGKDGELRRRFYELWFTALHAFVFLKENVDEDAEVSSVTLMNGTMQMLKEPLTEELVAKLFSPQQKNDL